MSDPANTYHPSKADDYQVDPTNLTAAQQKELNVWVASIINPIRQQLGNSIMHVNQSAIDFANAVAAGYDADKWSLWNGHDVPAIEKAAAQFGLDSKDGNLYECAASGMPTSPCTMNQLKAAVYDGLKQLLFFDAAHAGSVIGYNYSNNQAPSYFGLSVDKEGILHFEQIHDKSGYIVSDIQDRSKFNVNDNYAVPSNNISALKQQQASLQSQVNDEKGAVNADKQAVSNAQNALNAAKSIQTQANNDLASKQAALANANDALQQAQSKLNQDEATLAQAQKDIANAPAELQAANTQLAKDNQTLINAKNALATANTQLTNAKNVQAQDEAKLNDLNNQLNLDEQRLANDQSILAQLQKQLADYQNAPAELKEAQAQLADAQSKLAQAKNALASSQATLNTDQKVLADAQAKLNDAQAAETQAEKHLADLQKAYDAQHKVTEPQTTTTAEIGSTYTLGSHTISEPDVLSATVKASNKNIVHADTVTSIKTAKMTDKTASTTNMPQAGESSSSVASIIGAGLLAALSFLGLAYKKEEK